MVHDRAGRPPATRRARLALIAAGLTVAGLTGLVVAGGDEPRSTAGSSPAQLADQATVTRDRDRTDTVGDLLGRRAEALQTKDRKAFLATVDDADPKFRAAQREWFDNMAAVPFAEWRFDIAGRDPADLPAPAVALAERRGSDAFAATVHSGYRIDGYDQAPQRYAQVLTFTPRAGRWYVSGRFDPIRGRAHRELWDVGEVNVLPARHGLVLGLPGKRKLAALARELDRAVPRVDAVWADEWPRRVLLLATRTEEEMATLLGGRPAAYRQLAALTRGELGLPDAEAAAVRVVVNPKAFAELSAVGREVIMAHEITHVAARARTQPWTPKWLAEGFADYVGYRGSDLRTRTIAQELLADVERGLIPQRLPGDGAFEATSTALPQAYEMAWLACRMIVERYGGPEVLVSFFRKVGAPDGGVDSVDEAFQDVLATTRQEFTRQWQAYLQTELT